MVSEQERQGYLGDLTAHSKEELIDILDRQQKLSNNKKFLSRLADKGAKIEAMVVRIKAAIAQLEKVDETTDLFEKMVIQSEHKRRQRQRQGQDDSKDIELFKKLANRGEQSKVVTDELVEDEPSDVQEFLNSYEKVIKTAESRPPKKGKGKFLPNRSIHSHDVPGVLEKMSGQPMRRDIINIGDPTFGKPQKMTEIIHNYQSNDSSDPAHNARIKLGDKMSQQIENADFHEKLTDCEMEICDSNKIQTARPSSRLDDSTNSELINEEPSACESSQKIPTSLNTPSDGKIDGKINQPRTSDVILPKGKLKFKYDESLETEVYTRSNHHDSAKMISVEESVCLQQRQQQHVMELQAQHAAEKLAQRLDLKMAVFNPEGTSSSSMRYREAVDSDEDKDSDDDDDLDYPD